MHTSIYVRAWEVRFGPRLGLQDGRQALHPAGPVDGGHSSCCITIMFMFYVVVVVVVVYFTQPVQWMEFTRHAVLGRGQMGSALMGSLQFLAFWQRHFWGTNLSKSINCAYLFPKSVKINNFCSDPISVDPICPQPMCVCSCPNTVEDILGDPTSTPPGVLLSTLRPRVRKSILQLVPLCNCPVRLSSYTWGNETR